MGTAFPVIKKAPFYGAENFVGGIDKPSRIGYNIVDGEATMTVASSVANLKR
jgi:hypothetical protein